MPLQFVHQDITTMKCDAIVNPTDPYYSGGGGADEAIHTAAGKDLKVACSKLAPIGMGEVAVTGAFKLPCRHVIHTFGPIWTGGEDNEPALLRACYLNALIGAKKLGAESIAFPLISSGTFGFPKDRVLRIALTAIGDYLNYLDYDMEVYLCVYDRQAYELSAGIELAEYLKGKAPAKKQGAAASDSLAHWIGQQGDNFAVTLGKLIDKKGMTDVQCYKAAMIGKKTFWKIFNVANYKPSKATVFSCAIGLRLDLEETEQLLKTVGFSISHNSKFDMIIEFYISHGIYNIMEINSALYQYQQPNLSTIEE